MTDRICYDTDEASTGVMPFGGTSLSRLFDGGWDYDFSPGFSPRHEVRENEDAVMILFELPGVKRDDLHLDIGEGLLRLHGERKAPEMKKDEECRCSDLGYGAFDRSFKLPEYADTGKITAKFADGMLELTIPKAEAKKRVAIDIKVE